MTFVRISGMICIISGILCGGLAALGAFTVRQSERTPSSLWPLGTSAVLLLVLGIGLLVGARIAFGQTDVPRE